MFISTDRPSPITWYISSGAAFVTSSSYLSDGKVAMPCRCSWTTGAQTTSTIMQISGAWSSSITVQIAAVLCPKTAYALPVGTPVSVTFLGPNVRVSGVIQKFADGSNGLILFSTSPVSGVTGITLEITNNIGNATVFTAGQNLDMGEIWVGSVTAYKIANNVALGLADPTTNRRSHNNEPWPLFGKPYDTLSVEFSPMNDAAAYDPTSSVTFRQVRYSLSTAQAALILPRVYKPGTTTVDNVALNQLAIFGRPDKIDDLTRNGDLYWTAKMQFSQAPP